MSDEIKATVYDTAAWLNGEFDCGLLVIDDEEINEIRVEVPGKGHIYFDVEAGKIDQEKTKITGPIRDAFEKALGQKPMPPAIRNSEPKRAIVPRDMPARDLQVAELTLGDIKDYICPAATDQEAFMFLKLCQARNLNPFTNEAYLIKYGQKAQMVVGKEAFMRKAELHPQYAGFKAGIIIDRGIESQGDRLIYREGAFVMPGEALIGGWAEVYRKDRDHPIRAEVALKDYDSGKEGPWKSHKATMIRKVPLVQALREAFPNDLSGCYDASEFKEAPAYIEAEMVEA